MPDSLASPPPSSDPDDSREPEAGQLEPEAGQLEPEAGQLEPPGREQRVAQAAAGWTATVRALAGDDPLLHYRDLPDGSLDLTHTHPSGLAMLLAGRPCRLSALVREPGALADARRRARAVQARTTALAEERGLDAGWLAVGLATWRVPDGESAPSAPVLLRTCRLRPRGAAGDDLDLDLGGRITLNPALVAELARLGVHLDGDVIADLALREDGFDPRPVLDRVAETCRNVPGFSIENRYVVSTFVTAWPPLLADLADATTLARHDVVAALCGDAQAVADVGAPPSEAALADAAREVDAHAVLDVDTEQERALTAVVAGSHLVLDAPPGTGASQTIANLIAVLAATGRRVLFVSQKRAAIEAVVSRLAAVGLGDLVLDLPDAGADRSRVARELTQTLDRAGAVPQPDPDPVAGRRGELRQLLDEHAAALHDRREPWGSSAYDAQLALAELTGRRPAPRSKVRVRGEDLQHLDQAELGRLRGELREAAELGVFRTGPDDDPWFGARLETTEEVDEALERVTRLSGQTLPQARERLGALLAEIGMPPARNLDEAGRVLSLLADVRSTLEVFSAKVYDTSLADVVAATGSGAWRAQHGVRMSTLQRRKVRRHARALLRPGRPPADLHDTLVRAADQRRQWQELAGRGAVPRLPSGLAAAEKALASVTHDLAWLTERLTGTQAGGDLLTDDLEALEARLQLLAERTTSLPLVPKVVAVRDRLAAAGLEPLLHDLAQRDVAAQDVGAELDLVWWTSLLRHVAETDPRYGHHDGEALRRAAREFAEADRAHLAAAAAQVRRAVAGRLVRALDRHGDQARSLRGEAARDHRRRPLRALVRDSPDVLAAARPCWTMSPLVASQALPSGAGFDVVVLDEASQVSVAEAAAALGRGRQVVVVGDPQQLRPSRSLTRDVEDVRPVEGPSVLEALSELLPVVRLRTQHAARGEQVTAFANEHAYGGSLRVLPSASTERVVTLHQVDGTGTLVAGQDAVETTDAEVQRVIELVIEHARSRPAESLGVVTLTAAHAVRVEGALRLELSRHPDVAAFVSADGAEPFFVKVVDQVQGDTRDAIVLSVGFGRTPHGRVLHRFGAVGAEDGERRLTVATTRARRRMAVVAAFGTDDLDPDRLSTPGARQLRDLLAHAAGAPASGSTTAHEPDLLLADLAARLRSDELVVQQRYGAEGEAVDLAVGDGSGDWLVAVESDGPAYARTSARERERLRPEALARRGWAHERVWSTDVFRDPAREVARVRGAVSAVQRSRGAQAETRGAGDTALGTTSRQPSGVRWDSDAPQPPRRAADRRASGSGGESSPWTAVSAQRRGERPRVPTGRPVEDYRESELDAVVTWICSDTLLRTQEQLAALVRQQLGLVRRSSRVDATVSAAIARVVARGEVRTADPVAAGDDETAPTGHRESGTGPGGGVQAHDPHERWLLDQRPPHWD